MKQTSSATVQASPTRQSPRRQGKSDKIVHVVPFKKGLRMMSYREACEVSEHGEVLRWSTDSGSEGGVDLHEDKTYSDSEGPTELVLRQWVVKETQEADIIESENDSEAKTDRDDVHDNGEHWKFEARLDRSAMVHSNTGPATTTLASPDISEFEAYLEREVQPVQPEPSVPTCGERKRKKRSNNDDYWEGVLQSEKERLQKDNECTLTSVEAMMVGVINEGANGHTPMKVQTQSMANEKAALFDEPHGAPLGAYSYTFH